MPMEIELKANTNQFNQSIDVASQKLENLQNIANGSASQPIASAGNIQPIAQNNAQNLLIQQQTQIQNNNNLNSGMSAFIQNIDALNQLMQGFSNQVKSVSENLTTMKSGISNNRTLAKNPIKDLSAMTLLTSGIGGFAEYEASLTRRRIRSYDADVFGMERERIQGRSNAINTATSGFGFLGGALGAFTPIGAAGGAMLGQGLSSFISAINNGIAKNEIASLDELETKASKFESRLPTLEKALFAYRSDTMSDNAAENRKRTQELENAFVYSARNTGLDTMDFANTALSLAAYNNMSGTKANNITRNAALASRFTNTDIGVLTNFMGMRSRLGSQNEIADMNHAYSAMMATGMQKEMFGEFLQGLQDVIESGIAKGYAGSTDEVAKQMVMFSKGTDNDPTWQGKYGFQKLQQVNAGLANATSLSSSGQILAYQALRGIVKDEKGFKGGAYIKGADYLNTFSLMESGLNVDKYNAIQKVLDNRYGNDVNAKVMAWKEISGLNYTGSMRLAQMKANGMSDAEIENEIKNMRVNNEYATDQTKMLNVVNDIKKDVAVLSESAYDEKYKKILGIELKNSNKSAIKTISANNAAEWLGNSIYNNGGESSWFINNVNALLRGDKGNYFEEKYGGNALALKKIFEELTSPASAGGQTITAEESKKLTKAIEDFVKVIGHNGITLIQSK